MRAEEIYENKLPKENGKKFKVSALKFFYGNFVNRIFTSVSLS